MFRELDSVDRVKFPDRSKKALIEDSQCQELVIVMDGNRLLIDCYSGRGPVGGYEVPRYEFIARTNLAAAEVAHALLRLAVHRYIGRRPLKDLLQVYCGGAIGYDYSVVAPQPSSKETV